MTRLGIYFAVLIGGITLLTFAVPEVSNWLPVGGNDAIEIAELEIETFSTIGRTGEEVVQSRIARPDNMKTRWLVLLFLTESLTLSIVIMLPIAWTYLATRPEVEGGSTFVRALIVLPLCATTVVLLIQGSLALAFGLAAMVAAVRFRVRLSEPIDGIYIFSAICVGLAGGIGYMGVATVMAAFFCFANALMWQQENNTAA